MLPRLRSRNSIITFDVGTAGIRAFQLAARGSDLSCRDSRRLDFGHGQRRGDAAEPDYARLARVIGQGSFRGNDVGLVLTPPDVRFCALKLPNKALEQPADRVRAALVWEVAREMRADGQELEVRYWLLPPGHQQRLNVMAVALPTERALSWHALLARDQLRLRRIDVSPCTLVHLACRMWPPDQNELWGVLDLGSRHTTLTVVLGQVPAYVRSLSTSFGSWTDRLAEAFEVAPAEAEQIKRAHGIQAAARGIRVSQPDRSLLDAEDVSSVVFGLLREPLDGLVHEINRCFAYVMQNFSDVRIGRLLLAGGGANLRGLAEYLELQLGVSVLPLTNDPASGAMLPPGELPLTDPTIRPEQAAAAGGALLSLASDADLPQVTPRREGQTEQDRDRTTVAVNLVPECCHNARRRATRGRAWAAVACAAVVLVAGTWLALRATDRALLRLARQFTGVHAVQAELDRRLTLASRTRDDLAARGRALSALRQRRPIPAHLLTLTRQAPDGVVFTEIQAHPIADSRRLARPAIKTSRAPPAGGKNPKTTNGSEATAGISQGPPPLMVRMNGYAVDHDELTRLISTLQQLSLLDQVELLSATREPYLDGEALAFRLECRQLASSTDAARHPAEQRGRVEGPQ